jgi:hypothetical protein
MCDPTSTYATAGVALRVSGALKLQYHDKVERPSEGTIYFYNTKIFELILRISVHGSDMLARSVAFIFNFPFRITFSSVHAVSNFLLYIPFYLPSQPLT